MTKRRSSKRGHRKGQSNKPRLEVVRGADVLAITTGVVTTTPIIPDTFSRALTIGDTFAYYRFKHLKVTCHPNVYEAIDIQTYLTGGYLPGVAPDTAPSTTDDVYQLFPHMVHGFGKTSPTTMMVTGRDLIGDAPLRWFKTKAGTPDAQFEVQGNLFFQAASRGGGGSAQGFQVTIDYVCEFSSYVPIASTPFTKLIRQPESEKRAQILTLEGSNYLKLTADMMRTLKLN